VVVSIYFIAISGLITYGSTALGCAGDGGYLILVSDKPIKNVIQICSEELLSKRSNAGLRRVARIEFAKASNSTDQFYYSDSSLTRQRLECTRHAT